MKTLASQSTFELLPDEILLEVCRYLLCSDVLYSFVGLNDRITRMVFRYRRHVTLKRTSIVIFDYLCANVFPTIGSQIRSLAIDCCHSLLQDQLFLKYFATNMSIVFPNLERISLISFKYQPLNALLRGLHELPHLAEIRLYDLFIVEGSDRADGTQAIMQANDRRLTRILLDQRSCCVSFDNTCQYLNIRQLCVNLKTVQDLSLLAAAVPNVQHLNVAIEQTRDIFRYFDGASLSPLVHLTHFQLVSQMRNWDWVEVGALLAQMPALERLSLVLLSGDRRFVEGDIMLALIPRMVQYFSYGIHYFHNAALDAVDDIIVSWPSCHPVACLWNNESLFLHTIPWNFDQIRIPKFLSQKTSSCTRNPVNCYEKVDQLSLRIDETFTLTKSLAMISQCRRVRDIAIGVESTAGLVKEAPQSLPQLSRLTEFCLYGALPFDLSCFSLVLNAAPNLFFLDLPFGFLSHLINDQQTSHQLGQRITSLTIRENTHTSSSISFGPEHIPIIASAFPRLTDLYVAATHPRIGAITTSNESVPSHSPEDGMETSRSSDSLVPQLLIAFEHHKLISLSVSETFQEKLQTDAQQWLRDYTILCDRMFRSEFFTELNRLDIWM